MSATPLYFADGERGPLFGLLNEPVNGARACGVVLVSPIGTDLTRSDRAMRHLAERLAAAGFRTLRFDPRGTGDSFGDLDEADIVGNIVNRWLVDIAEAAALLRARGATQIALVGLRLGATLAMAAAARSPVDSLVLWNPCVSGAAFVSEAVKMHGLYERLEPQLLSGGRRAGGQEALGLFLPDGAVTALNQLDPTAAEGPLATRALVIDGGLAPAIKERLLARLQTSGGDTTLQPHPGQKFLVTVSHRSTVPDGVIGAIVEYLSAHHGTQRSDSPIGSTTPVQAVDPTAHLQERAVRFGNDLLGILSQPRHAPSRPGTAVVLLNAGTVNRSGPHRLSTRLARRWAALGFTVLRVDLPGIGDSPAAPGAVENLCYPPDAIADVKAALDFLEEQDLAHRFVIAGLCSGGDLAFQLGLGDARVAGAVIMNPRTFCMLDLQAVESKSGESPSATVQSVPDSLRSMAGAGVETLLVVSDRDPGVHYVDQHFAAEMAALKGTPHFTRVEIGPSDHTFTPAWAQDQVSDVVTAHLIEQHG